MINVVELNEIVKRVAKELQPSVDHIKSDFRIKDSIIKSQDQRLESIEKRLEAYNHEIRALTVKCNAALEAARVKVEND